MRRIVRAATVILMLVALTVGAGARHAAAQLALPERLATSVAAWGWDDAGQLGDGVPIGVDRTTPVTISLTQPVAVAAGADHSLALKADGTVWSWGANQQQQLGRSCAITSCAAPGQVPNLTQIVSIAAGFVHNVVLKRGGTVWAWGANSNGSLGNDNLGPWSAQPVQILGLTSGTFFNFTYPTAIAAGSSFGLARRSDGTAWAWGRADWGQLGNNNPTAQSVPTPVQVSDLTDVVGVAAGHFHGLARTSGGHVWAWGRADQGQLGDNVVRTSTFISGVPVQVKVVTPSLITPLSGVVALAGGENHSLALKADGTVWAWGDNSFGQLGDGTAVANRFSAVQVVVARTELAASPLTNVVAIAAGRRHSLAVKADGTVWAWGENGDPLRFRLNRLGTGNNVDAAIRVATQVRGVSGAMAVAGGFVHSLAKSCSSFSTSPTACEPLFVLP